jgi:hypothetical protein
MFGFSYRGYKNTAFSEANTEANSRVIPRSKKRSSYGFRGLEKRREAETPMELFFYEMLTTFLAHFFL